MLRREVAELKDLSAVLQRDMTLLESASQLCHEHRSNKSTSNVVRARARARVCRAMR